MSECLSRLVGLDGCTEGDEPFKLNQIGYSREQVAEFMDESFASVNDFFAAAVNTAIRHIESDALTFLPAPKDGITVLESMSIARESEIRTVRPQTGRVGIMVELLRNDDYLRFNISTVRLFVNFSGTRTVEVYNLSTGQLVGQVTVTLIAGQIVEIPVSISIAAPRKPLALWIGYDSQGMSSFETVTSGTCGGCRDGYGHGRSAFIRFGGATIAAPFTRPSMQSLPHTGGIMLDYSVTCDTASYLCNISTLVGLPLLYKVAMVILEYGLRSGGQFSEQKTLNAENNQERYMHASTEYQKYLRQNLGKAFVRTSRCFYCSPKVGIQNRLPA